MMEINPGISRTVALIQSLGFETCDSGDGRTHDYDCDRPYGYVVIRCPLRDELVHETNRLCYELARRHIRVLAIGTHEQDAKCAGVEIQATYDPNTDIALIDIAYIDDQMLEESD